MTTASELRDVAEEHFNHDNGDDPFEEPDKVEEKAYKLLNKAADELDKAGRRRLPDTRNSITHKFNVDGHQGYFTVGLYEDGTPGELFIVIAKEGSTFGGLCDVVGILTSISLQSGVSMDTLVNKFVSVSFLPAGGTTNSEISLASSIIDYIFTWLGLRFCDEFRAKYNGKKVK